MSSGAFCAAGEAGAIGVTSTGLGMVCTYAPGDIRNRWRSIDPAVLPQVGSVARLYRAYFSRDPDPAGFAYWLNLNLAGALSLPAVSQAFTGSAEFVSTYGTVGNEDFLRLVYRNVLRREPDPGGYAYWLPLLTNGTLSRGALMTNFSESAEYKAITGTV